jgi:hypothetical protein
VVPTDLSTHAIVGDLVLTIAPAARLVKSRNYQQHEVLRMGQIMKIMDLR